MSDASMNEVNVSDASTSEVSMSDDARSEETSAQAPAETKDAAADVESLKRHHLPQRDMERTYLPTLGVHPAPQDLSELTVPGRHADAEVADDEALHESIIAALKTVYDPEIPVDIYALGLIYGVDIDADRRVEVRMTLTAPACPVAGQLVSDVANKVGAVPGVSEAHVELVWEPFWTPDRMSEEARLELGMF